jgi:hypothetical protein
MTIHRDDMVLIPRLDRDEGGVRGVRGRRGRRILGEDPRERSFARRAALTARGARAAGAARMVGGGLLRAAVPVAIIAAITAIAIRLGTGRTFQNLGQLLNDATWRDLDDKARANQLAFLKTTSDDQRMATLDRSRAAPLDDFLPAFEARKAEALRIQMGRAVFLRDNRFTHNSKSEILMLRGQSLLEEAFWMAERRLEGILTTVTGRR